MTTTTKPTRAEINRRNAQKSTGPKSIAGKARSRFNAVKHGLTARTLVLPDEDAGAFQARLDTWTDDLQPQNDLEHHLIQQAVHGSWRLERADRAEAARLSHLIESRPIADANHEQEVALALGYWLLSDRGVGEDPRIKDKLLCVLGKGPASGHGDRHLDILDHPQAIVFRLESTAAGCQWLLDQWSELRTPLEAGKPWTRDEKLKAVRLLGKQPGGEDPLHLPGKPEATDDYSKLSPEARVDRKVDLRLDPRLAVRNPATLTGAEGHRGPGRGTAGDAGRGPSPACGSRSGPANRPVVVRRQHRGRAAAPIPRHMQPVVLPEPGRADQGPPFPPGSRSRSRAQR